jgi:hypothetical protein
MAFHGMPICDAGHYVQFYQFVRGLSINLERILAQLTVDDLLML